MRGITVEGELTQEQQAQRLEVANACPMHGLLTGEIRIQTEFRT